MARTETILLLRLLQTPESSSVSNDNDISISSRSSLTKAWDKLQLVGFYRFNSASLVSCNQQCLRNQWCTSTNHKLPSKKDGKGNCALNKHEISIAEENINFVHRENVSFSVLLRAIPVSLCQTVRSAVHDLDLLREVLFVNTTGSTTERL